MLLCTSSRWLVLRVRDLEKLADLLDIAIVNLKEANRCDKFKDGLAVTIIVVHQLQKSHLPQC